MAKRSDYGDGDTCPLDPEHGNMFVLTDGRQYCAHHGHDARREPCFWPLHWLEAAVVAYNGNPILPDLSNLKVEV